MRERVKYERVRRDGTREFVGYRSLSKREKKEANYVKDLATGLEFVKVAVLSFLEK